MRKLRLRKVKKLKAKVIQWARGTGWFHPRLIRVEEGHECECPAHDVWSEPPKTWRSPRMAAGVNRGANPMYFFYHEAPREEWHLSLMWQIHTLSFFPLQDLKDWVQDDWKMWWAKFPTAWPQTLVFLRFLSQFGSKVLRVTWPRDGDQISTGYSIPLCAHLSTNHQAASLFKRSRATGVKCVTNTCNFFSLIFI